ncbi:phosphatase YfbT [Basidiobolus meristosporus CBS 931.73]|uniref:Phosphatase YfbT n=1 Tax=Basidiobolus meristosporus CBS 931.73 TaxID=1314790 RepID=A0A1Y1YYG4_9FUNG|nr:phosphatase YfbT [Basidiobolus meristosporus CBS 931.73]|eukprot:ORY03083.1 phosphatase YfbT [Basidiobolus meristosporus CBS 931.73]
MVTQLQCKALLFDMDGTLIDTTPAVERYWKNFCKQHSIIEEELFSMCHGVRSIEVLKRFTPEKATLEHATFIENEAAQDAEGVTAINGAFNLLHKLPANAWAIVTSAGRGMAELRFNQQSFPFPKVFVTGSEVTHGKPHPEGYLKASKELGIEPIDCVVFEDAPAGIQAALNGNMRVIGIVSTHTKESLDGALVHVKSYDDLEIEYNPDTGIYTITVINAL